METKYPHIEAMEDNNFQMKDLPDALRKKVYAWNAKYSKFEDNPTERMKDNLMRDSVTMADSIQDFAEKDIQDDSQEAGMTPSEQNQPDVPEINGIVNPQSQTQLQEAVKVHLTKEGRIYHTDLKSLLGKSSLPDRLEVGELVLHRSYAFYYPA